jgi:hypothetical protein
MPKDRLRESNFNVLGQIAAMNGEHGLDGWRCALGH